MQGADGVHRANVAVEADEGKEEDAAVHAHVEGDPLELAEQLDLAQPRLLDGHVEREGKGEHPGRVAQSQVQQEDVVGAPGPPDADVADHSRHVAQDPHWQGHAEENQQDVAVPAAVLKLAAEFPRMVRRVQENLWDGGTGGRVSSRTDIFRNKWEVRHPAPIT